MIIVKTPLRIEFLGGSTDMQNFYSLYPGRILNTTIDKYVYVILNKSFDNTFRIIDNHKISTVKSINKIKSKITRGAFKHFKVSDALEVVSLSDIHQKGSGLGSSSSFVVGLTHALNIYSGNKVDKFDIAEAACYIEIDIAKSPIGKQDQYSGTFGGLTYYKFDSSGKVSVNKLKLNKENTKRFNDHLIVFYTGGSRSTSELLKRQNAEFKRNLPYLKKMSDLVPKGVSALETGNLKQFSQILFKEWSIKRNLATGIINEQIESMYKKAIKAGAWGGRISGAGGGGFMILIAQPKTHNNIRKALKNYKELPVKLTDKGTEIILR